MNMELIIASYLLAFLLLIYFTLSKLFDILGRYFEAKEMLIQAQVKKTMLEAEYISFKERH